MTEVFFFFKKRWGELVSPKLPENLLLLQSLISLGIPVIMALMYVSKFSSLRNEIHQVQPHMTSLLESTVLTPSSLLPPP